MFLKNVRILKLMLCFEKKKPDWMKQEHHDLFNHSFRKSLWGIGIGYDYTFHSYSVLDFFAGVSLDYQSYEYREDETYMYYGLIEGVYDRSPVYEDFYKEERSYYYWDRVRGISVFPNSGLRFSTSKFCVEAKFGLYCSRIYKKAYAFDRRKALYSEWKGESFYPEKNRKGVFLSPDILIGFTCYL